MKLKKLYKIKTGIELLQVISVFLLIFFSLLIYTFSKYIYHAKNYNKENMVVDSLYTISKDGNGAWLSAVGYIESGEKKFIL